MTVHELRPWVQAPGAVRRGLYHASAAISQETRDERGANPDVEAAMLRATRIFNLLEEGVTVPQILARENDLQAIAMGHLLHCAIQKNQINDTSPTIDRIADRIIQADMAIKGYRTLSRHTLILTLFSSGLICPDIPIRNIKPAGTSPNAKVFSTIVEQEFGVSYETIASPCRQRDILKLRFQAIWAMRNVCGYSLALIGQHFGGRDHTTVLNSINQAEILRKSDAGVREKLDIMCDKIDILGVEMAYGMIRDATKLRIV